MDVATGQLTHWRLRLTICEPDIVYNFEERLQAADILSVISAKVKEPFGLLEAISAFTIFSEYRAFALVTDKLDFEKREELKSLLHLWY